MRLFLSAVLFVSTTAIAFMACSSSNSASSSSSTDGCTTGTDVTETPLTTSVNATALSCVTNISPDAPDWIKDNFHCVTVKVCPTTYVFITNNLPPYKTAYYSSSSGNTATFPTTGLSDGAGGRHKNPNTIITQSITMTIPKTPTLKTSGLQVTMGSGLDCLGLSTYGVCLFNNRAAPPDLLADEFETMDNGDGHPQNTGKYHHHTEPWLISHNDDKLVGIMLDGYPVYGKYMQGTASYPTLDATTHSVACTTTEFPDGTYCYHVNQGAGVNADIIGDYFRGAIGSVN
ncbi:MAG: YHYH protein [Bdellovibrionales bacterium]|nr:YHYH protein [Bdellovibrionales bacterium]